MGKIEEELDEYISKTVQELVLAVHSNLVETTPVDTGWARANWLPSVGEPIDVTSGTPGAMDHSAVPNGQAQIATWKLITQKAYISNNVPYIQALNDGHSKQAPAGFVERAIQKAFVDLGKR